MGYAVINLSKSYVKRLPPGHFLVVRSSEAAAFKKAEDAGLVALVKISEDRKIGPRTLRGRHAYLLDLVGKQPAEAPVEIAPEPTPETPAPEPTPEPPAPEPTPEPPAPEPEPTP